VNSVSDNRIPIIERLCTVDAPNHLSKSENVVSKTTLEDVNLAVQ
jgi:hypothetical protein